MTAEPTGDHACLNCATLLVGPHCHNCGQQAHIHRSASAFLHDLLHGALHFEGKTFHTLPLLAWKPGELTRRYIDGERARFVSPMALFLFSVFLMFAVFQIAGISPPTDLEAPFEGIEATDPSEATSNLEELRKARAEMGAGNPGTPFVDQQIKRLEQQVASATKETNAPKVGGTITIGDENSDKIALDKTGIGVIDKGVDKWRANPSLMAYKLQANSYKFSWLLIPLSVPFVWLLFFWKRNPATGERFGMYDHAVFVTYSLAFMTLFYVALVLLGSVGLWSDNLGLVGVIIPPVHIFRQLKGTYGLSWFSALWRTALLCALIFVILFLFIDALLLLGVMG